MNEQQTFVKEVEEKNSKKMQKAGEALASRYPMTGASGRR
jgi:hypothetical protein